MSKHPSEAPYPGGHDDDGPKTFVIPKDKMDQIKEWKEGHNAKCRIPFEWYGGVTPFRKYKFTFQESGLGDDIHIICDCGAKFYPDAGDENI